MIDNYCIASLPHVDSVALLNRMYLGEVQNWQMSFELATPLTVVRLIEQEEHCGCS